MAVRARLLENRTDTFYPLRRKCHTQSEAPATKGQVLEASNGHIQAEAKLIGRYGR